MESPTRSTGGGGIRKPESTTDEAFVRWKGVDGKEVENSPVTVNDAGDIATPGGIAAVGGISQNGTAVAIDGHGHAAADVSGLTTALEASTTHIADAGKHREINDAAAGATDLWSASKISTALSTKSDAGHAHSVEELAAHTHAEADITDLDKYTEAEVDTLLLLKTDQTAFSTHTGDSAKHREINDAGVAATDLLSAEKIISNIGAEASARTLADSTHAALTAPHSATSANTASTIMLRDAAGQASVGAPTENTHIARKWDVDTHVALTNPHAATSESMGGRLIIRDALGCAKVGLPTDTYHIARKKEVDDHAALTAPHSATAANTASTLMMRNASGQVSVGIPIDGTHVARKWDLDVHAALAGTAAHGAATTNTASTIAARDGVGDLHARLFRSEWAGANASIGAIMTQVDLGGTDNNYIRPSTLSQVAVALPRTVPVVAAGAVYFSGPLAAVTKSAGSGSYVKFISTKVLVNGVVRVQWKVSNGSNSTSYVAVNGTKVSNNYSGEGVKTYDCTVWSTNVISIWAISGTPTIAGINLGSNATIGQPLNLWTYDEYELQGLSA